MKKRKRGRPQGKKNSKQLRKYVKRVRQESGIYEKRHFITMTCKICKKERKIRTNNKELYTKDIIDNYICLLCRPTKRKV